MSSNKTFQATSASARRLNLAFDENNMKGQLTILIVSAMVAGAAATLSLMEYVNDGRIVTIIASAMTSIGTTLTCFGQIRMIEKQTKELIELSK